MKLRPRRSFNRITLAGLLFPSVANIARWVLEKHTSMLEGPRDGLLGLLFGVVIGLLLLSIRRQRESIGDAGGGCGQR